ANASANERLCCELSTASFASCARNVERARTETVATATNFRLIRIPSLSAKRHEFFRTSRMLRHSSATSKSAAKQAEPITGGFSGGQTKNFERALSMRW